MKRRTFLDAATTAVRLGKAMFDADAGFVAWSTEPEGTFEFTFLAPGHLETSASLRRLVLRAVKAGRPAFSNVLSRNTSAAPSGHRRPSVHNALVAPIFLSHGEVSGALGLINRPAGFSRGDRRLAIPLA